MVRLDDSRAHKRRAHWQRIVYSACEQSGRIRPPLVEAPVSLNAWFGSNTSASDLRLLLSPDAEQPLAAVDAAGESICLLVGPEGGLTDREIDDAVVAGFRTVSLGPRILRTETAAIAALTAAGLLWGDLGDLAG